MRSRRALPTAALKLPHHRVSDTVRSRPARSRSTSDSWRGLSDVIVGTHARGFDVEAPPAGGSLAGDFYATGRVHSIVCGSGWEATSPRAVSRAAWQALNDLPMAA